MSKDKSNTSEEQSEGQDPGKLDQSETPQRFSEETLFAFALPESVQESLGDPEKEAVAIAKEQEKLAEERRKKEKKEKAAKATAADQTMVDKAAVKEAKKAKKAKPQKDSAESSNSSLLIGGGVLLAVCAGGYFFLVGEKPQEGPSTEVVASKPAQVTEPSDVSDAVPDEQVVPEEPAPETEVPSDAPEPPVVPPEALPPLAEEALPSLDKAQLLSYLETSDIETLSLAIQEAAKREDAGVVAKLEKLSSDENYLVRVRVIKAIASSPSFPKKTLREILVERINDSEYLVRGFSAKALSAVGGKEANAALMKRLEVEENEIVRKVLKAALISIQ